MYQLLACRCCKNYLKKLTKKINDNKIVAGWDPRFASNNSDLDTEDSEDERMAV